MSGTKTTKCIQKTLNEETEHYQYRVMKILELVRYQNDKVQAKHPIWGKIQKKMCFFFYFLCTNTLKRIQNNV